MNILDTSIHQNDETGLGSTENEKQLRSALRQFSRKNLFDIILPLLSDYVTCDELVSQIRHLKCKTTERVIVDVFVDLLKEREITDEEITDILPIVMLMGIANNPSRRMWTAYTLQGHVDVDKFSTDLEDDIKHNFHENNIHSAVKVYCLDKIHWIQIIMKKLVRSKLKVSPPIYVAHFIGEPYLFFSPPSSDRLLEPLTQAFGYDNYKFSNLNGKDLYSLLQHLKQKGSKRGFKGHSSKLCNVKETTLGKDFSQYTEKRKFISDLMGPCPPKLSNYVVEAKNLPWKANITNSILRDKTFNMKIEFKTMDTIEMLKDMAESGALRVPPPSYVINLLGTGKNNIKLRVQGVNGATDSENQTDAERN
ncbi:Centromere protein N [Frankliniella fusca]|uniref:Centromere protein N n=1 Tax=Frankliniella fusca TaxID=407009 RepID=A0AAE1LE30_9NEOP|nr:Centromere protein N [Frankliniella fusca]